MATNWGAAINVIGFGKIYGSSWAGEYPFINIVGDANDYRKRVLDDSGTVEAQGSLVHTLNETVL